LFRINLISTSAPDDVQTFDVPKAYAVHFSPDAKWLCTWEPYAGKDRASYSLLLCSNHNL